MAKAVRTLGQIAGAVALIGTGVGAIAGIGLATSIGTYAGLAATAANIGAQALAKPPAARGSITQMIIDANAAQPYVMGEGYFAGVLRHRAGYGGKVNKVQNPYWGEVVVYSGGGPVESIAPRTDFQPVSSWFSGYLATSSQLGLCPEPAALTPYWSGMTGWGPAHKLSGQAAILWNFRFDKKGERFASGRPVTGAEGRWVKVYDPRKDDTFPGGVGPHRLGTESTYEWSDNPALHAGTYAFGRYQNGKRTLGIGLPADGIDWQAIAAWANVCEANGWTIFGVLFEGHAGAANRWENLVNICTAGGADPIPGGTLTFRWHAPAVPLDTITEADNAGSDDSVVAMQSYRDRVNVVVPKYTSPDHNWELVQAEAISVASFIAEDGEERQAEWPFNFVRDPDQAAQLATYRLMDSREFSPIELHLSPRFRAYRPGDCLRIERPDLGLSTDAIIVQRQIDPADMSIRLTMRGETPDKHPFALGQTGVPPATPALGQSAQDRDETAANALDRGTLVEVVAVRRYAADYTGTINSGVLPDYIMPTVTYAGEDARTDDDTQYSIATEGVTATVNSTNGDPDKGRIAVTAVSALNGWIDLTVTYAGEVIGVKRIVTQRNDGLPSGFGGTGSKIASDNAFLSIDSTSFTAITDVLTVTVAAGETLHGTAPLDYQLEYEGSTGSRTASAKWQYAPAGTGTWTDFGAAITGTSTVELPDGTISVGSGSFNQQAGTIAAGDYDVRLVAALNSAGRFVYFNGTATIEAKV